jgi:hypothetical protein
VFKVGDLVKLDAHYGWGSNKVYVVCKLYKKHKRPCLQLADALTLELSPNHWLAWAFVYV